MQNSDYMVMRSMYAALEVMYRNCISEIARFLKEDVIIQENIDV